MKLNRFTQLFVLTALCIFALPVMSHHNFLSHYPAGSPNVTIKGTVKSFWFVNPHIRVYVDVPTENGESEEWIIEGRGPTILMREGWTGGEIKKGDTIEASGKSSPVLTRHLQGGLYIVNGERISGQPMKKEFDVTDYELGGDGAVHVESHLDANPGAGGMGGPPNPAPAEPQE